MFAANTSLAVDVLVGVNQVNTAWLTAKQREGIFSDMRASGVQAVRLNLQPPFEETRRSILEAHRAGLAILLVTTFSSPTFYERGTQRRPKTDTVPAAYPLSRIDPIAFERFLLEFWRSLAKDGVELDGIEVGNEIDWAEFNGDLATHEGRVGFENLTNSKAVKEGLLRYIAILHGVRRVREQIQVVQRTPILAAGMANIPAQWAVRARAEALDVKQLNKWLIANGAARSIDAFAMHHYPNPYVNDLTRRRALREAIGKCKGEGVKLGCYVTEWGVRNTQKECPIDDERRLDVVKGTRQTLDRAMLSGEVKAIFYFEWSSKSQTSIWRCGGISASGKAAIAPLSSSRSR